MHELNSSNLLHCALPELSIRPNVFLQSTPLFPVVRSALPLNLLLLRFEASWILSRVCLSLERMTSRAPSLLDRHRSLAKTSSRYAQRFDYTSQPAHSANCFHPDKKPHQVRRLLLPPYRQSNFLAPQGDIGVPAHKYLPQSPLECRMALEHIVPMRSRM